MSAGENCAKIREIFLISLLKKISIQFSRYAFWIKKEIKCGQKTILHLVKLKLNEIEHLYCA